EGKTVMLVSIDGEPAWLEAVADTIKDTSREAVARLKALGLDVIMMTGDNRRTAEAIAKESGITSVIAEVLPEQKAAEMARLQKE
ncbi:HAD family hydrolase, partial [Bacillus vallismortis]|nr:HAD family hydrolase [Bacillus vallismortis]